MLFDSFEAYDVQEIIQIVKAHAPNYDIEKIYQELEESKEEHQYAEYQ